MSFIYSMECAKCKTALTFRAKMDSAEDVLVYVDPCEHCVEAADTEGFDRAQAAEE